MQFWSDQQRSIFNLIFLISFLHFFYILVLFLFYPSAIYSHHLSFQEKRPDASSKSRLKVHQANIIFEFIWHFNYIQFIVETFFSNYIPVFLFIDPIEILYFSFASDNRGNCLKTVKTIIIFH